MSTATVNRPRATAQRTARPGVLHGLTWLVWRQHRAAAWTGLALLLVVALASVYLHHATGAYQESHHITGCSLYSGPEHCMKRQQDIDAYRLAYRDEVRALLTLVLALPVLGGLFVGAPLISRELEAGTHQLAWSQSVTRSRWLAHKLALPLLALTLVSAAAGALASWTLAGAGQATIGIYWYTTLTFIPAGPAVVGYALLAMALGAAAGALIPKTVTAMVVTLGGIGAVIYGLQLLRPHLPGARTTLTPAGDGLLLTDTTWILRGPLDATAGGHVFPQGLCQDRIANGMDACLKGHGATHRFMEFHPVADMRGLQFVEGGVCAVLALLLLGLTWWWLHRRAV